MPKQIDAGYNEDEKNSPVKVESATDNTSQRIGSAPNIQRLDFQVSPLEATNRLSHLPFCLLLESSMIHPRLGKYSFVMADPLEFKTWPIGDASCLDWLSAKLNQFSVQTIDHLPAFQGGIAGLISYEFNQSLEKIPTPHFAGPAVPAVALGLYDTVIAWDHISQQTWIVSQGFPHTDRRKRTQRANERANYFLNLLRDDGVPRGDSLSRCDGLPINSSTSSTELEHLKNGHPVSPQFDIGSRSIKSRFPQLTSDMSKDKYRRIIERALRYIQAGDIFQVNLAQHLAHPATDHPLAMYRRLRERNPSTFAAFFDLGEAQIISASPERLASVRGAVVETRPIKGTRRRTRYPDVDLYLAEDLRQSDKDRAENLMIVDLMRNDLSRICQDDSVQVTQLMELETYASVMHLVSAVQGRIRTGTTAGELIRAIFPGGSITGAPKIRAMEVIAELEPTGRGAYCGSIGYFGFDGSIDMNILIRTITAAGDWWTIPVGGGIVADSDPDQEYDETWTKAAAMLESLS